MFRFVTVNRKWDLAIRHTLGRVTVEHAIDATLVAYGRPLSIEAVASELSLITGLSPGHFETVLPRFLRDRSRYVQLGDGKYARSEWVLVTGDSDDDVMFNNFFMSPEEEILEALRSAALAFPWDASDLTRSAIRFVDSQDISIPNRVLSYFAWRGAPSGFDPIAFFDGLRNSSDALLLSGCRWCPASVRQRFADVYHELGQREEEAVPADEAIIVGRVLPQIEGHGSRLAGINHFARRGPDFRLDATAADGAHHGTVLANQQFGGFEARNRAAHFHDGRERAFLAQSAQPDDFFKNVHYDRLYRLVVSFNPWQHDIWFAV